MCDQCQAVVAALQDVKSWCQLNRREGSVIYKRVCDALVAWEQRRLGIGPALDTALFGEGPETEDYEEEKP